MIGSSSTTSTRRRTPWLVMDMRVEADAAGKCTDVVEVRRRSVVAADSEQHAYAST